MMLWVGSVSGSTVTRSGAGGQPPLELGSYGSCLDGCLGTPPGGGFGQHPAFELEGVNAAGAKESWPWGKLGGQGHHQTATQTSLLIRMCARCRTGSQRSKGEG